MILDSFDARTLIKMDAALDRACARHPEGTDHGLRAFVAENLMRCAQSGRTTPGALAEAAEAALARWTLMSRESDAS